MIFYSGIGVGSTKSTETYTFVDNVKYANMFYGPQGKVPTNPYAHSRSEYTWQLTLLGLEYQARFVSFGGEIGYGYKGLGNIFVGYRF